MVPEYGGYSASEGGRGKGGPRGAPPGGRMGGGGMGGMGGMRGGRYGNIAVFIFKIQCSSRKYTGN